MTPLLKRLFETRQLRLFMPVDALPLGRSLLLGLALGFTLTSASSSHAQGDSGRTRTTYEVTYDVGLVASEKSAHVAIQLGSGSEAVEWIRFKFDEKRYRAIEADGKLVETEDGLEWRPPQKGGSIKYIFSIDQRRDDRTYDARCARSWAIFRGQDLVPQMRIRTEDGARSRSRMRLRLPEDWSAALPYARLVGGTYLLDDPLTGFDRPKGWFAFGDLGVVRETIEGTRVAIAGPAGQGIRRMDILALLKWNLPALNQLFGELPERIQIVVAGDPMWRGGLSGPKSVYLHVDRPLIGQDSSSPLIHELVHSLMRARSADDGDWVVEGIAEYYSIALLRRSETLTATRYESAIDGLRDRGTRGKDLFAEHVSGDTQALAVSTMIEIDEAIRSATGGARSLDNVVRVLTRARKNVTTARFREAVATTAGRDLDEIFDRLERYRDSTSP